MQKNIALLLADYESSIDALSECIAILPDNHSDKDLCRAYLACSYSFAGNYAKANEITGDMFGDYTRSLSMTWEDVAASLDDNDIAIEFTYVSALTTNKSLREGYYAGVIKKGISSPEIVYISESLSADIDMYSNSTMTDVIFGPLRNYMEGV